MSKCRKDSKAADYIKSFKLNKNDFPDLLMRLNYQAVKYYLRENDWKKTEVFYSDDLKSTSFVIEILFSNYDYFDPKYMEIISSIIKRNQQLKNKLPSKGSFFNKEISDLLNLKNYKYISNELIEKDEFG